MAQISVAVIGLGYFGNLHAAAYADCARARLVAVCDVDPVRAAAAAERFGANAVQDYRSLVGKVDAVSVVVPTICHYAVAADCLAHGIHVLVEKPMCGVLSEADSLIGLARERGAILQVGLLERFNVAVQALLARTRRPRFIECLRIAPFRDRGTDANVVMDLMIHDIDLLFEIVGAPVESVDAVGIPVISPIDDIANVRLRFANGCVANLTASRVSGKVQRTIRVFEESAYFVLDLIDAKLVTIRRGPGGAKGAGLDPAIEQETFTAAGSLQRQIDSFVGAVASGTAPSVTGDDCRRALAVADAIGEQIRVWQGRAVQG